MEAGIVPVSLLLHSCLRMPVSETESKEKHGGCSREGDMEISEEIQMRERRKRGGGMHSHKYHLRHLTKGGRDRASELILAKRPEDATGMK